MSLKRWFLLSPHFLQHEIDLTGIIPVNSCSNPGPISGWIYYRHLYIRSQVPELTPSAQGRGDGFFFTQLYKDGFSADMQWLLALEWIADQQRQMVISTLVTTGNHESNAPI